MKNYISIDGKKIEISQETADNIAKGSISEDKYFDLSKLEIDMALFTEDQAADAGFEDNDFMFVGIIGEHKGRAFHLDGAYNWELKVDLGFYLLIPTRK